MRELALITLKIVDEQARLYPEEVSDWYTSDGGQPAYAEDKMDLLSDRQPRTHPGVGIHDTSDAMQPQFKPTEQMALLRLDICNQDSALGYLVDGIDPMFVLKPCFAKLERAGLKLLDAENKRRTEINDMSKLLSGDGVEKTDEIQFYAVFQLFDRGRGEDSELHCNLEGVLRLDKIDMAIDEAILI